MMKYKTNVKNAKSVGTVHTHTHTHTHTCNFIRKIKDIF